MSDAIPHIVLVDDEEDLREPTAAYLADQGLDVSEADGGRALDAILAERPADLVVLDVTMPEEDGFSIARRLRATGKPIGIIMLTARRDVIDRVVGLELGADDYVTKPFGLRELLARVRAALRRRTMDRLRPPKQRELLFTFAGWRFDQRQRELTSPAGEQVTLTKSEFALLSAFVQAPNRTLSREHLLRATRIHEDVYDRSIDVQILRLRRKLEDDAQSPRFIRTERGMGYRFLAEAEVQ